MSEDTPRRVALVTGASRGIGAAIAATLAAQGHEVLVNFREDEVGARTVVERIQAAGGSAEMSRFDVRKAEETQSALDALQSDGRIISILVNNAGVARDAPFPALSMEDWETVTRTTLDGFFNVTRPLVMPMVRQRWGRIVNIASVSGVIGNRGQVNYSAAKAGLIGATRSLSIELGKRRVTVNAVAPGLIETEMLADAPVEEILNHIPLRRLGRAEEVAALVGFLVGEQAAYITGQVIGINGGLA